MPNSISQFGLDICEKPITGGRLLKVASHTNLNNLRLYLLNDNGHQEVLGGDVADGIDSTTINDLFPNISSEAAFYELSDRIRPQIIALLKKRAEEAARLALENEAKSGEQAK